MTRFRSRAGCWLIVAICLPADIAVAQTTPYTLDARTDAAIVLATLAIGTAGAAVSDDPKLTHSAVANLSRADVNWFDRSATSRYSTTADGASTALVGVCALAPVISMVAPRLREDWPVIGVMFLETWFVADWVPDIPKGMVDRVRPYAYNDDAPLNEKLSDDSARRSFFSGHATMAFAMATLGVSILKDYYPEDRWSARLQSALLTSAAGAGALRYVAGAHYPSDVLAGAIVGTAIGYGIPRLHRTDGTSTQDRHLSLQPRHDGWLLALRVEL